MLLSFLQYIWSINWETNLYYVLNCIILKVIGSFIIGSLNLAVAIISRDVTPENEFAIFILLLLLVMTFGSTLGPAAWV